MAEASRTLAPLASALGGTMMLAGAWAVAPALTAALEDADLARAAAGVVGLLLGLPLAIWPWLVRSGVVEDPGAPWALALSKLAAEHGLTEHLSALFRWSADINAAAWKAASEAITAPLLGAITTTAGRPSFSISTKDK